MSETLYQKDYISWTKEQAAKLRAGSAIGLDFSLVADELQRDLNELRQEIGDSISPDLMKEFEHTQVQLNKLRSGSLTGLNADEFANDLENMGLARKRQMGKTSYQADFYEWAHEQAAKLRAGIFHDLDIANIAIELEESGLGHKHQIENRRRSIEDMKNDDFAELKKLEDLGEITESSSYRENSDKNSVRMALKDEFWANLLRDEILLMLFMDGMLPLHLEWLAFQLHKVKLCVPGKGRHRPKSHKLQEQKFNFSLTWYKLRKRFNTDDETLHACAYVLHKSHATVKAWLYEEDVQKRLEFFDKIVKEEKAKVK